MSNWISWNEIFDKKMNDPAYREKFERGYAEFTREVEAELAAERAQQYRSTVPAVRVSTSRHAVA